MVEGLREIAAALMILIAITVPGLVGCLCFIVFVSFTPLAMWAALQVFLAVFLGGVALGTYCYKIAGLE